MRIHRSHGHDEKKEGKAPPNNRSQACDTSDSLGLAIVLVARTSFSLKGLAVGTQVKRYC